MPTLKRAVNEPWSFGGDEIPNDILRPPNLQPSAVPLVIVTGPPAAGKTTYVRSRYRDGDCLIDLGDIILEMAGRTTRSDEVNRRFMRPALIERNARLSQLASRRSGRAWFIVSAPTRRDRTFWSDRLLPEQTIIVATDAQTCCTRILADPPRAEVVQSLFVAVGEWWARYEQPSSSERAMIA